MTFGMEPYLALILLGFLPSEVWRWVGLAIGRGLDENSEMVLWVRGVATALIAGVVARIVMLPPGALATIPLEIRIGALAFGFLAFLLVRRSAFAGVIGGEAALIGAAWLYAG